MRRSPVRVRPQAPKCVDERCSTENTARKCGVFAYLTPFHAEKSSKNAFSGKSVFPRERRHFRDAAKLFYGLMCFEHQGLKTKKTSSRCITRPSSGVWGSGFSYQMGVGHIIWSGLYNLIEKKTLYLIWTFPAESVTILSVPCGRFSFVPQGSMKGKAKSIMKLKRNFLTTLLVVSFLLMADRKSVV